MQEWTFEYRVRAAPRRGHVVEIHRRADGEWYRVEVRRRTLRGAHRLIRRHERRNKALSATA